MIYLQIFWAFFVAGILGYGGGPASIPLIEKEVVDRYEWLTVREFSEVLALGNALPGPIATKMAGYIGFEQAGVLGALIGVVATVAPSLFLMLGLLGLLRRHKESPRVKRMTVVVRPIIAVLLGVMAYDFLFDAYEDIGSIRTLIIGVISYLLLGKYKIHPAFVIGAALLYGAFFLG
jgi:chromate transporter